MNPHQRLRAAGHRLERLHYWQQLSQGYLFLLAEEDWSAFLRLEGTGQSPAEEPKRRRHFRQSEGKHGLSPWNIAESVTQFWEMFLAGPEKAVPPRGKAPPPASSSHAGWKSDEDLDNAMLASRDYSEPFRLARRVLDPNSSLVLFPFLAHFALKTSRPAHYFEEFLAKVAPPAAAQAEEMGVMDLDSSVAPGALYPWIESCCNELVRGDGESGLLHAPELFSRSPLRDNPVYAWAFARLARLASRVRGGTPIDTAICLPVRPHLKILAEELTPPCLRFSDRAPLALALHYLEKSKASPEELETAKRAAQASYGLQHRIEELNSSARGY